MERRAFSWLLLIVPLACARSREQGESAESGEKEPVVRVLEVEPVALPAPRHGHRIERLSGGLLSFGGFGDASVPDREMRQTWWLAAGQQRWQRRADMRRERAFFASAVYDDTVFAIGDSIDRYDFAADRWIEVVPPGRLPTSHFSAAAVGKKLYVLGGVAADGPQTMLVVDLASGAVSEAAAPPSYARGDHFHFVQALEGRLHVIGGLDGKTFVPRREHWVHGDDGWRALAPPPEGLWAKFAVQAVAEEKLYLFGDFGAYAFDPREQTWTPRARLESMIVMPQSVVSDRSIWVLGGMVVGQEGERTSLLWGYDIASDAWIEAGASIPR